MQEYRHIGGDQVSYYDDAPTINPVNYELACIWIMPIRPAEQGLAGWVRGSYASTEEHRSWAAAPRTV
jgi:hypothetical protein